MNEEAVLYPTETILFGEKKTLSNQYYLDLNAGTLLDVTEQGRHSRPIVSSPFSGGSNHGFADGSVRYIQFGKSLCPMNEWAVTDAGRASYAICITP